MSTTPNLCQLALNGALAQLTAVLDADPQALDRPQNGGPFDSRTALMCAASRGHADVVAELLRRGANAALTDKRGTTAEALARKQNHTAVAELIVKAPAVAPAPTKRKSEPSLDPEAVSSSAKRQKPAAPAPAPNPPASAASTLPDGRALSQMASLGNADGLLAALDRDPSALNRTIVGGLFDGRSLLMCAASRGHAELVRALLCLLYTSPSPRDS